ncbi:glycoprotein [megalopteran chu-related virus 119]|uniref:Glycoprotein n=1 Tax=megalopteran chu-related virus 119 TaxID=2847847 RepID=A0A7U3NUW5_9VIRU|nr:glycoprotein [megalopteran chu-related virus 119]QPB73984.1 glycoprotein [megalopteran chu-related virus 119]
MGMSYLLAMMLLSLYFVYGQIHPVPITTAGPDDYILGHSGYHFQPIPKVFFHDTNRILSYFFEKPMKPRIIGKEYEYDPLFWKLRQAVYDKFRVREKRFLDHGLFPFIGWLQQKLVGVATTSDLDDLRVSSKNLSEYIEKLREVLKSQSSILHHLIGKQTEISNEFNALLTAYRDIVVNITDHMDAKFQIAYGMIQATTDNINHNYLATLESMIIARYNYAISQLDIGYTACREGKIPETLFSPSKLKSILRTIASDLKDTSFTISIPISEIHWFYELDLCYCKKEKDGIQLLIAIPVRFKKHQWTLEEVQLLPIRVNGENYFYPGKKRQELLVNNTHLITIQERSVDCVTSQARTLAGCLVQVISFDIVSPESCLYAVRVGLDIKAYKEKCLLTRSRDPEPIWYQVNYTHWIYSGQQLNITIKRFDGSYNRLISLGGDQTSSIISLPCNYYSPNLTLSSLVSYENCIDTLTPVYHYLVSLHHINYDLLQLPGKSLYTPFHLSKEFLNQSFSLNLSDFSDDEKLLQTIERRLKDPVPVVEWSSPYHSIWTYLTYGIIIIVIVIFICIFRKCSKNASVPAIVMSRIQGAHAFEVPQWTIVGFDLVYLILILVALIIIMYWIRKILKKMSCHHIKTKQLRSSSSYHIDLAVLDPKHEIIIGLKNVTYPGYLLHYDQIPGFVSSSGKILSVEGFSKITCGNGTEIEVNGIYIMPNELSIDRSAAILRFPSFGI